ncbi:MAG: leucyl aminopeptidase [Candidatus Moraniibacteriota bacterium]
MKFSFAKKDKKLADDVVRVQLTESKEDEVVILADNQREIHLGAGERKKMTQRKLFLLARRVVVAALSKKIERIVIEWDDFRFAHLGIVDGELGELISVNMLLARHQFIGHKSTPEGGWPDTKEVIVRGGDALATRQGFACGEIIGREVNACRHLANLPGGDVVPKTLADEAKRAAKDTAIKVTILEEAAMEKLGMGGVLGVGKGSSEKSKFIIMEYWGAPNKKVPPIVLVGKGVTFDTGGINLKPSDSILGMNMDMSGGSAVIHALAAAAKLGVKKNIIALVPAVENMPSGSSYRPGDILRSMSGKTIEVLNTDAEGRIILADALTYAKRYHPALVVDVATLTGAAVVALGERASAIFTRDIELESQFREWGEQSGDFVWPLPLWEEYDEEIKGIFGDVANVGKTRWGGAITAASFLAQFAEGYPWVHIDMAPRMTAIEGEFLAKGAAGAPVRLLVKMLENF